VTEMFEDTEGEAVMHQVAIDLIYERVTSLRKAISGRL